MDSSAGGKAYSRREVLTGAAGAAVAAAGGILARPGRVRAQGKPGQIVALGWGGSTGKMIRDAFYDPFEKETGIKVLEAYPYSYGKLKAAVEASRYEWDVTLMLDQTQAKRAAAEGLLLPIDYKIVNGQDLHPKAKGSHWVAGEFETVVMAYQKGKYGGRSPQSWADFWDAGRFPGTRSLHNWVVTTIEAALMADGVAPERLYPLDFDRGFKSLDRIKKHVKTWWDVSAQGSMQQMLKDREVDLINGWTGRIGALIMEGVPVGMQYSQGLWTIAPWAAVKTARYPGEAMRFLDYISQAAPQARLHSVLTYGPTNLKAFSMIKPEVARLLPSHPDNLSRTVEVNTDFWQEHEAKVTERFNAWVLKG